MSLSKKQTKPIGTGTARFYLPITTLEALRAEAAREGCSMTYIVGRVLNAYARGEIRQEFSQSAPGGRQ